MNEKWQQPKNSVCNVKISQFRSQQSGHDAYEMLYSYLPAGLDKKKVVQETFTLVEGKVYRIWYYANEETYSKYQKELHIIKDSYTIL